MPSKEFIIHDAADVGIDPVKLTELLARVNEEVDNGLLPSAQIAIARHGKLAAFETFGDTPKDPLYSIFSLLLLCINICSIVPKNNFCKEYIMQYFY